MTADDGRDAGSGWVKVECDQIVKHIDGMTSEFNEFSWWELGARAGAVDVAADGGEGREGAERVEDLYIADVSGVENMIDSAQSNDGFRAQEAMRV